MKRIMVLALLMSTFGCSHAVNVAQYKEGDLDLRVPDVKPPEYVVNKKKPKAAVLPFSDAGEFEGKLSTPSQEVLSQLVSQKCGLELAERSNAQKIFDEVKFQSGIDFFADKSQLAQMASNIDFVIVSSVASTNYGADYSAPRSYTDKKGKTHYVKASCSVTGNATVNIRVINSATGIVSKSFPPFNGRSSNSFEVSGESSCRVGNPLSLVIGAVNDAIGSARVPLQDAFPYYGYLYKTMTNPTDPSKRIAYINLGRQDGVKAGEKVDLIKYVNEVDRIKKTQNITTQEIAEVTISETDLRDDSSIIMIPEEVSSQIMPGLAVKTKGKKTFAESLSLF